MPYKHAGEIGDIWKHMPLCEILKIEKPLRYHESNSAYSGYNITINPKTEYGILKILNSHDTLFVNSEYYKILIKNGINNLRYTGSPGLAMNILSDKAHYFFHDIEREALDDVEAYAQQKGLSKNLTTFCDNSILTFLNNEYIINESDFIFLDPYTPFDKNEMGFNFFDIFSKAVTAKSKVLLWYGYENLNGQKQIIERLKTLANDRKVEIYRFDVWQKTMNEYNCEINPGVPGCGLACVHLSNDSINILKQHLKYIENCYINAKYNKKKADLFSEYILYKIGK